MTATGSSSRQVTAIAIALVIAIAFGTSTVAAAPTVDSTSGNTAVEQGGQTGITATVNDTKNVTVKFPSSWTAKNPTASPSAATVTNGSSQVEWEYNSNQSSVDVSLDLDVPSDAPTGNYPVYIVGEDGAGTTVNQSLTVTVQQPATFNVTNLGAPSTVSQTNNVSVNATIINTGDVAGSTTVEYAFNGTVEKTQSVSLDPGNSQEVTFNYSTVGTDVGTYTHGVSADNASTAQVEVEKFLEVVGVDASGFNTIQTFVNVETEAGRNGNLSKANFTVYENGVEQTVDSVTFTQNESRTNLDIVYVFDRSGSMGDEIDDLRNQIKSVSQDLNNSGRDVRFALVTFSDDYGRYDQNLTSNVTKLENALDQVSAGGGTERDYDAIHKALQLQYRGDAQKVIVTITDEDVDVDETNGKNQSQVATELQQTGVSFVAVSPDFCCRDPSVDLRVLANRTGGIWYDFNGVEFPVIIDDVTDRLSNTWIVTYDTSDQIQSNTVRTVNVTVNDPTGVSNSAQGSYIPPQVDITTVDTGGFPTINATVNVNTTNAKSGNLGADNFSLSEDDTQRTIQDVRFDSQTETYEIEYETADPNKNGTVRDIELTVNLSSGATVIVTESYQAPGTPSNQLPTVNFTASPTNPDVGQTVTFNASDSVDPDGTIDSYEWDLDGDGNFDDATGVEVTTSYSSSGNRQIGLRVNDTDGGTNTTSKVVSVGDTQTVSGGQPGFGAAVAVVALLALALFAYRRD